MGAGLPLPAKRADLPGSAARLVQRPGRPGHDDGLPTQAPYTNTVTNRRPSPHSRVTHAQHSTPSRFCARMKIQAAQPKNRPERFQFMRIRKRSLLISVVTTSLMAIAFETNASAGDHEPATRRGSVVSAHVSISDAPRRFELHVDGETVAVSSKHAGEVVATSSSLRDSWRS